MSPSQSTPRRTATSVPRYEDAEHAVDQLSDHAFPADHVPLLGSGCGALLVVFWGILFGAVFTTDGPTFWGVFAFSVLVGVIFGGIISAISHAFTDGRRDF